MSPIEATALMREAIAQAQQRGVPVAKRLLAAADARGYQDPDSAVKDACVALFDEVRSLQSTIERVASGTFVDSGP